MRTGVPTTVRYIVLICLIAVCSLRSNSQSISSSNGKFELGVGIGPSFFLGDLGGTKGIGKTFVKDVNFPFTKLMKGIYFNYQPTEWLGIRVSANFGTLEASDSIIKNHGTAERFRKQRNLNFKSNIMEGYMALEFYPTVFFEQYDGLLGKIRPYGLIGIGMFHFNPQGQYYAPNGEKQWIDLQPLRTEGQGMAEYPDRKPYELWQMHVPMGFGAKYYIKENMYVGMEILHRMTFTDYVDDVSTNYINPTLFNTYLNPQQAVYARQLNNREQFYDPTLTRPYAGLQRGDPKENDAFFSGMLRLGWRLGGNSNSLARRQLKCPVFY
jgi:hypothetical protein